MKTYFVESPFQLLQAVEYVMLDKDLSHNVIIRLNGIERNDTQLINIVNLFGLKGVRYFNLKSKESIIFYLFPLLFYALFSKEFVVGDENSFIFRLIRLFSSKNKITILDDGVATFNSKYKNKYRRFTVFRNVLGVFNSFTECRRINKSCSINEEVNVIIGGKLVEENICSKAVYHQLIEKMMVFTSLNKKKTIYVAHRGEDFNNIKEIRSKFNVDVFLNQLPIELLGYEASVKPILVMSVLSTALYSMSSIFDSADFYVFPLELSNIYNRKESIESLYNVMREDFVFLDEN